MDWGIGIEGEVIGLVSPAKEYKLALRVNQCFEWEMAKQEDINMRFKRKSPLIISNFLYATDMLTARLLKNRSASQTGQKPAWLLPELKTFDFILYIQDYSGQLDIDELTATLTRAPEAQLVKKIPISDIKHIEHLVFE